MKTPTDMSFDSVLPQLDVDMTDFFGTTSISFVVADARRPDMPIVYVNRAFEMTTGYSHRFVVGRNCRFLQGPDTSPEAVKNIAVALKRRQGINQTLLNYRADGSSFVNDLVITPIHDNEGDVAYFVGVQREVNQNVEQAEELLRRKTIDIVRQQVQLHLSVVMEMSRLHLNDERTALPNNEPVNFVSLLRRLEILDLLYENLTENSLSDEKLDVGAYVSQIAAKLVARNPRAGVRINISTESAIVPLDIAVRIGVILAELIDSSLAQSFAGMDSGEIEVILLNRNDRIELTLYDDGHNVENSEINQAQNWLARGDLTLKVIERLLSDIHAVMELPKVDQGREIKVIVPIMSKGSSPL